MQMQSNAHPGGAFARGDGTGRGQRRKHRLEEDEGDAGAVEGGASSRAGGHVHFAVSGNDGEEGDSRSSRQQVPTAIKRRKVSQLGFEPVFEGLSLGSSSSFGNDNSTASSQSFPPTEQADGSLPTIPDGGASGPAAPSSRGRGRQRQSTPFPTVASEDDEGGAAYGSAPAVPFAAHAPHPAATASSQHRKRSSSRNRARHQHGRDAAMGRAPDPSRPHVVFIDSLSDSSGDEGDEDDDDSPFSRHSSTTATPGNSPSSERDEGTSAVHSGGSERPVIINKRLREHLRRQKAPLLPELLARGIAGGAGGVQERGLVLYRPLPSWGVVEEPDEEEEQYDDDGIEVQEMPGEMYQEGTGGTAMREQPSENDMDEEDDGMDVD